MGIIQQGTKQLFAASYQLTPPFPKTMLLEPTNACNLNCSFCLIKNMRRQLTYMDLSLAKDILQQAYANGVREVGFYVLGEPLLHPRLPEIVKVAHQLGYEYIYITTNGELATREKVSQLAENGLNSIKFSINAGTDSLYEEVHGKNVLAKVLQNLRDCIAIRQQAKDKNLPFKRVMVSSVYSDETLPSVEKLKHEYGSMVDDFVLTPAKHLDNSLIGKTKLCPQPFNRLHVSAEGYLTMCCHDTNNDLLVADLNHEPLLEAWTNEKALSVREKFLKLDFTGTPCGPCPFISET